MGGFGAYRGPPPNWKLLIGSIPTAYWNSSESGRQKKPRFARLLQSPLTDSEPSTPSLPCDFGGNRWQPVAKRFGLLRRFRGSKRSHRLRPIAPPFFHNLSILSATARSAVCRNDNVGARKLAIALVVDPSLYERGSKSERATRSDVSSGTSLGVVDVMTLRAGRRGRPRRERDLQASEGHHPSAAVRSPRGR
jgi:hypothetical protein